MNMVAAEKVFIKLDFLLIAGFSAPVSVHSQKPFIRKRQPSLISKSGNGAERTAANF